MAIKTLIFNSHSNNRIRKDNVQIIYPYKKEK